MTSEENANAFPSALGNRLAAIPTFPQARLCPFAKIPFGCPESFQLQ
jgi:hypothetical protein